MHQLFFIVHNHTKIDFNPANQMTLDKTDILYMLMNKGSYFMQLCNQQRLRLACIIYSSLYTYKFELNLTKR